jgi:hypothetical protein
LVNSAAGLTAEEAASGHFIEVMITSSTCGELAKEAFQNATNAIGAQIAMILRLFVSTMVRQIFYRILIPILTPLHLKRIDSQHIASNTVLKAVLTLIRRPLPARQRQGIPIRMYSPLLLW